MRTELSATYVRRNFGAVLNRVQRGERIVVCRRGQPIAAIVPPEDLELLKQFRQQIRKRRVRKSMSPT
ncbi:MAG: type II toxin-antitoxin system Phd/YefM family antitoxin [Terriglobales bacterium]